LRKWGTSGTGPGQFSFAQYVAATPWYVFVSDALNHRIQKFDSHGAFLTEWGSFGSGTGNFREPMGIALDLNGDILVADNVNQRIQKFDAGGTFITAWGDTGSGDGEFLFPRGLAVDSQNNVYVVDYQNHRVQKFDNNGTFLLDWGTQGTAGGKFLFPRGIAVDLHDRVYVADSDNNRIQKFDATGDLMFAWGSEGENDGEFDRPRGVATDALGNIYVSDDFNYRIQKFDTLGTFLAKWGTGPSSLSGNFNHPWGGAVDSCGRLYVMDRNNNRVQQFGDPTPCGPNTPVGNNVTVALTSTVSSTFTSVSVEGVTTLDVQSTGPEPPVGIEIVPSDPPAYYEVMSNATFAGPVQIDILYDPADVQGLEENLLLFHYDQSIPSWREITTEVDTVANFISGSSPGLSVFAIVEPGNPTAVREPGDIPRVFRLYPNYPNPFQRSTQVLFDLPESGPVEIRIFDLQGRVVKSLMDEEQKAGRYSIFWWGDNDMGQRVAPGIYFYRLETRERTATQKLIKIR
jgi:sugar lactone lactonase YvrE